MSIIAASIAAIYKLLYISFALNIKKEGSLTAFLIFLLCRNFNLL